MTLYKVTAENGRSYHGGSGKWTRNRWRNVSGKLIPCKNGLHLCRRQDLIGWLGPVIWEAEYDGEIVEAANKVVVRRARVVRRLDTWNERAARLFAADCAERVLPIFEKAHPNDDRPRTARRTGRRRGRRMGRRTDRRRGRTVRRMGRTGRRTGRRRGRRMGRRTDRRRGRRRGRTGGRTGRRTGRRRGRRMGRRRGRRTGGRRGRLQ